MKNILYHHGIKGQKWGIRRYQNEDGTLTAEGRERYGIGKNGWLSKQGIANYKSDLKDLHKRFDDYTSNMDITEKRKALFEFSDERKNAEVNKILNKQLHLEDEYKDFAGISKDLMSKGEKYIVAVNNKGKFDLLPLKDESINRAAKKGYEIVKSFDEVLEKICIEDYKKSY